MGKLWIKSCPRCHHGEVYMDHDQYGWYATCLQCGYSYDLPDIAETVVGDIAAEGMTNTLVEKCLTAYGGIDIIVNNAGMAIPGKFEALSMSDWRRLFEVNFFTPLALTYAALPHLRKSNAGKIVNVAAASEGFEALAVVRSSSVEAGELHLGTVDGPRLTLLELPYPLD